MNGEPKPADPVVAEFQRLVVKVADAARAEGFASGQRKQATLERERRDSFLVEARAEGVAGERERAAGVLRIAIEDLLRPPRARDAVPFADKLADLSDKITKPEPPAEEPMTVEKLIEKWCSKAICFDWGGFQEDLQLLVKAQARRDAEILSQRKCEYPPGWSKDMRIGWMEACDDD